MLFKHENFQHSGSSRTDYLQSDLPQTIWDVIVVSGGKSEENLFFFFQGPFWSSWVGKMEILLKTIQGILAMAK